MNAIARLGAWSLTTLERSGRALIFLLGLLSSSFRCLARFSLVTHQIFAVGVLTVLIIVVAALFVGMVLGLQGYYNFVKFGAESSLGAFVALSLTRELGPVLAALLYTGRAGSALTAEIGLMKATDQLAAMEMMAVDPVRRVIAPRFVAGVIALPLLTMMFIAVGVMGGYLVGVAQLGLDDGVFWSTMQDFVDFRADVVNGLFKSVVFAIVVNWIAVFEGYDCQPTSEGVSRATTRTVVSASLAVLGLDYLLTALMFVH